MTLLNLLLCALSWFSAQPGAQTRMAPLHETIELNVRQGIGLRVAGANVIVRLLDVKETRDSFRQAVREVRAVATVNDQQVELVCGNYRLPVNVAGIQIDCPAARTLESNSTEDAWGLLGHVRLRVWPGRSPWIDPSTFTYPLRQKWFASGTQMSNEPVHVDGGEVPANKKIYYHAGLDIGGAEGLVDVVAATGGLVVSSGTDRLPGHENTPVTPRYDVVYILDGRGWYYRYSHMKTIDPAVKPGARVTMGQKIGVLGKEGASGGWSHLHFEIKSMQPSGRWGTEDGYAFLWQSYVAEFKPPVIAVARPHQLAAVGEQVTLDGSLSWSASGAPLRYSWSFSNGAPAVQGPRATRLYERPGTYSEILTVIDASTGVPAFDFAVVQVLDPAEPQALPPSIQAAYSPTMGLRPGDVVTFKTRTFRTTDGEETWDFGDGTPPVKVKSDGNVNEHDPNGFAVTAHRFQRPGDYIATVSRTNRRGFTATARVWVQVVE